MKADRIVVMDAAGSWESDPRDLLPTTDYREIVYSQMSREGGRGMSGRPGTGGGFGRPCVSAADGPRPGGPEAADPAA